MSYHHLTREERNAIFHLFHYGVSLTEIGRRLGRSASTISREMKRNIGEWGGYCNDFAQSQAECRSRQIKRPIKRDNVNLWKYIRISLSKGWSPETIAGRIRKDYPRHQTMRISHEAIYQWIYRDFEQGGTWYQHLRRRHRRRRKWRRRDYDRGRFKGRISIEDRPAVVDHRKRFGDWESDTVQGSTGCGCLVTHVERKSRYLVSQRMENKKAATLTRQSTFAFRSIPSKLCKTLTVDNGSEFADFKQLEKKLGVCIYFAHPYSAWERGTNENTNGLLRQYFPKGTDFKKVSPRKLAKVVKKLNNRPRKCLDYRTPNEVLFKIPSVALDT